MPEILRNTARRKVHRLVRTAGITVAQDSLRENWIYVSEFQSGASTDRAGKRDAAAALRGCAVARTQDCISPGTLRG